MNNLSNAILRRPKISVPSRNFFGALNFIFNRVDKDRIKEVGPDRACAEWLMRNGAHVKWVGSPDFVSHYNNLPLNPKETGNFIIEEVKAHEAAISHYGFDHFHGCCKISKMSLHECWYINDKAINKLEILKDSLVHLKISSCADVTELGLQNLKDLCNLKTLTLGDLKSVKDFEKVVDRLANDLPDCKIVLC